MERSEIEILTEQRSELRNQFSPHNPANATLKLQIEQINEKIRALVARKEEGK